VSRIDFVYESTYGDWVQIFVDGKLFDEGHSIGYGTFLSLLACSGHEVVSYEQPSEPHGLEATIDQRVPCERWLPDGKSVSIRKDS
jgi:hypothetical protein